jgi:SAM-dependent methyltransferase
MDLSRYNPVERFTGLAGAYDKYRPSYPAAALDFIVQRSGLNTASVLVDVGSGTGISSRLFAARGIRVVGIEPNDDMRALAASVPIPTSQPTPEYRKGNAETTGLSNGFATAVLSAQAFHWFDPAVALPEFHRILQPDGWVALMWNERDETDPFTAAYGAVIRTAKDAATVEGPRGRAGDPLLVHPLFEAGERVRFAGEQEVDEEGALGRAFSASYAPRAPAEVEAWTAGLRQVFAAHQRDGRATLRYETTVYLARRRTCEGGTRMV